MSQVPLSALEAAWPLYVIKVPERITQQDAAHLREAFMAVAKRPPLIIPHGSNVEYVGPTLDSPIYDRLAYEYGWAA